MEEKICKYCGGEFEAEHGNMDYCSDDCSMEARKERQKHLRDGVKTLLPILFNNHRILDSLWTASRTNFTEEELVLEGLDPSLCRHLYPIPGNQNVVNLDFGTYFLETSDNFLTFKLCIHETITV